jgi:hypothetical protein
MLEIIKYNYGFQILCTFFYLNKFIFGLEFEFFLHF